MINTLSKLLIILGILSYISVGYFVFERTNPMRLSFANAQYAANTQEIQKVHPQTFSIPDLSISLPIIPAKITNGTWEATKGGVSYLTSSPLPGEKGNSILYGHNFPNLLGKLPQIKPGQVMTVSFSDGTTKTFEVEYTVTVTPDQTHILEQSQDKRITVYTCTGFLDSKRFVVVGILKEE